MGQAIFILKWCLTDLAKFNKFICGKRYDRHYGKHLFLTVINMVDCLLLGKGKNE